jgi:hypothetical protein
MNSRNQVGLELIQIDIEGSIETQRSSDRRDDLGDQPVKVGKARGDDVEIFFANVVNGFVINLDIVRDLGLRCSFGDNTAYHEGAVRVLEGCVGSKDGVVRFNNGVGQSGGRVDTEFQLGLFAIVRRKAFEDESTKAGTGSTSK